MAGDFSRILDAQLGYIRAISRRFPHWAASDYDDVAQELCLRLLEVQDKLDDKATSDNPACNQLVKTIMQRAFIDLLRKYYRHRKVFQPTATDVDFTDTEALIGEGHLPDVLADFTQKQSQLESGLTACEFTLYTLLTQGSPKLVSVLASDTAERGRGAGDGPPSARQLSLASGFTYSQVRYALANLRLKTALAFGVYEREFPNAGVESEDR